MKKTVAEKILSRHLVSGELKAGTDIAIKIDQTLTQDATGTMACLQFEALGIPKVRTELSVSYVDHNMLQSGFENADDHAYLKSVANKYGMVFSRPGNGICHQVHLERFAAPGKTLLGSDSHTPTAGGMGSIAIGAGGLDIAAAMAGYPFYLKMPEIYGIKLSGKLKSFVTAKDLALYLLKEFTVKGGVGKIFEFCGEGLASLSLTDRATIANMGTEMGLTTTIFPSDEETLKYLKSEGRESVYEKITADEDAVYAKVVDVNLSKIEPMIAKPHSPDNVVTVASVAGTVVDQSLIGSCTNSSYKDLMTAAHMLKGKKINKDISFGVAPGSRQVLSAVTKNGALAVLLDAGTRMLESACGFCIGMGQAPRTNAVSLRTINRNFEGRCGTQSAGVFLCSVETAVAAALTGKITDPTTLGLSAPDIKMPEKFDIDDSMFVDSELTGEIVRGPNIAPLPLNKPLLAELMGEVLIKVGDNITTDHIMPAGTKILPLRSNVPRISKFVFCNVDEDFAKRAEEKKGGFIIGGDNYGQGSSREHAALAPMYLGVKAVIVKSFARIHKANLVNFGILPLEFANPEDYNKLELGDKLVIENVKTLLKDGKELTLKVSNKNLNVALKYTLSERERELITAGGQLNYIKDSLK